jgi:tetratricopeptide (TPR) repeat protein
MEYAKYSLAILLSVNVISASIAFDTPLDTKAAQQSSETQPDSEQSRTSPSSEQLATWVANLGSDSFQLRRESFVQLWRAGKPALQAIQAAMLSTDKQQAETAGTLEILIRLNVSMDDPSEAADLLSELSSSPESALVKLCERGYWKVAVQLLDMNAELLETLRSSEQAYSRMNLLVDEALEQEDVEFAWPVIRKIIPYQQALWIALKQGLAAPELDEANPIVQAWTHFLKGNHAEVQKTDAPAALRADLAIRGFQWSAFSDADLMLGLVGRRKSDGQSAARAVMLDFASQTPESEAIWESLLPKVESAPKGSAPQDAARKSDAPAKGADDKTDEKDSDIENKPLYAQHIKTDRRVLDSLIKLQVDPGNLERVLLGMLLSGRSQIVQDYLLENSPEAAWALCLIRGEQEAALSAMGLASDFSNFDEWLAKRRDALYAEAQKPQLSSLVVFRSTVQLANDMQVLGKFTEADETFKVLVSVCRVARMRNNDYWQYLASGMTRSEARHRFLDILAENYDKMDDSVHDRVLSMLYPECVMSADVLYQTAPEVADSGRENKWEALEQLYAHNREFFGPQHGKIISAWLQRARSKMSQDDSLSSYQLIELAKLADGVGQSDLALEFAREPGQGSVELWAYVGKILKERGDLKNAIEYFSAIRRVDSGRQESILDEASSLLMLGRITESQALKKSRWLRPLMVMGPNSWFTVGQRLNESGRYPLAKEYLEPTFLLASCDTPDSIAIQQPSFVGMALEYSQVADELKDVELSADLYRAILASWLSVSKPRSFPPSLYASIGTKERTRRAILAARSNDMVAFGRHVLVAEDLQPQGIELVEDTYPELVATGNQKVADELFARFEERLLKHLERWPKDATTHNNLAWMYARCNLKLEEALEHSQIAVELSPHSAVLLDTLAEVQFRLNQFSAAIDSMHRCIKLDPRDPHMRRQLERFLKAQLESRK